MGVSPHHKGHKCLSSSGRLYISKDVEFNEGRFPYQLIFQAATSQPSLPNSYPSTIPLYSLTQSQTNPYITTTVAIDTSLENTSKIPAGPASTPSPETTLKITSTPEPD